MVLNNDCWWWNTYHLGIETTSGDTAATEGEAYSVAYSTTLGGASVAIGYTGFDANSKHHKRLT